MVGGVDRGPGGGTLNYDTRVQQFSLNVNPNTGTISSFQIVQTIKFTNNGTPLNGIAPNPTNVLGNAFDPEGFVILPRRAIFWYRTSTAHRCVNLTGPVNWSRHTRLRRT